MPEAIMGRDTELETAERFLDQVPAGRSGLLIEGTAGIGKTTVWRETLRRASARGYRVLTTRPAEAEAKLSYAGLADLIGDLEPDLFDSLPTPQLEALDVALARRSGGADRRTLFAGFVSLLTRVSEVKPTLLGIDDLQWLDGPSVAALEFAIRRLSASPIGVVASIRIGERTSSRTFERAFDPRGLAHLRVGPLSVAVLHHLVAARLGQTLQRPLLVRLEQASGGNPLFALEIARELGTSGAPRPGEPLPVPQDLEAMIRARARRLSAPTRAALLTLASVARPMAVLVDPGALSTAEEAGLVRIEAEGSVSFVHPLYASAVYRAASPERRRAEHGRLATIVTDPEERARHLALATEVADPAVAAVLSEAAEQAASRGAPEAAVELGRLALQLTPAPQADARARRQMAVGEWLWLAGDHRAAAEAVSRALELTASRELQCEGLLELMNIRWEDDKRAAVRAAEAAVAAAANRQQSARAHLAVAEAGSDLDLGQAISHARAALEQFDADEEPFAYADCIIKLLWWELLAGKGADQRAFERALEVQRSDLDPGLPLWMIANDDLAGARASWEDLTRTAQEMGAEYSYSYQAAMLAQVDLWLGRWPEATKEADLAVELAELVDSPTRLAHALFARALVDGQRGESERAREACRAVLEIAESRSDPWFECAGASALGSAELAAGDVAAADVAFTRAEQAAIAMGMREPVRFRFHGDQIEAVLALGDVERAAALVERLEERARVFPRPWTLAISARGRAAVLAARGDLDRAIESIDGALGHHVRMQTPFELARTLLVKGEINRRRRAKRLARESLEAAGEIFGHLGARQWAGRAATELARVVARHAPSEMTPTEREIAVLAAAGRTNRDIAAALFMSPKTVEKRLASVYDKLGIRSRAELGARMAHLSAEQDIVKT